MRGRLCTWMSGTPGSEGRQDGGHEAADGRRSAGGHQEGRGIVMRVPLEGGGRLVVEMTKDEANDLSEALKGATG